jgi:uncharacterized protein (DUF433 family)
MNWRDYIVSEETILMGKPTIKGTRLSVEFILSLLAQGWTEQMIFENYPHLTHEQLQAVFSYAYDNLQSGLIFDPQPKRA